MSTLYDGTSKLLAFVHSDPLHTSQDLSNSILIIENYVFKVIITAYLLIALFSDNYIEAVTLI